MSVTIYLTDCLALLVVEGFGKHNRPLHVAARYVKCRQHPGGCYNPPPPATTLFLAFYLLVYLYSHSIAMYTPA